MLALATLGRAGPQDRDVTVTASPGDVPVPVVQALPLDVAYRFDASIDQELIQRVPTGGHAWTTYRLQVGAATRSAFAIVLPAVFSSAIEAPTGAGYDGLVTIRLVDAWAVERPSTNAAGVIYQLEFEPHPAAEASTWEATGRGHGEIGPEILLSHAVRDAMAQLVVALPNQPAVRAWLDARSGSGRRP